MSPSHTDFSAIILSAGRSSRMGVSKFSLHFDNHSTFLERIVNTFCDFGCVEIIVVLNTDGVADLKKINNELPQNVKIAINSHPEWERFYSLKTGVRSLKNVSPVFISNIDNPFINVDVLKLLAEKITEHDYIYPSFNGNGGHPFLLSEKVISDIISEQEDQLHMRDFLFQYSRSAVEVNDEKVLLNINSIDDYRRIIGDLNV
jgi:molybdenum cofactor cytidylyltransferase